MPELTLEDVQEELAKITYKPGWSLSAHRGYYATPNYFDLVIKMDAPDSTNPDEVIPVGTSRPLSFYRLSMADSPWQEIFHEEVYRAICWLEMHEVKEFFKVNGQHFVDPHPELTALSK